MPRHPAVSIYKDLAACKSGVGYWASLDETPSGVDIIFGIFVQKLVF
jgi:hypothetical protein